MIKFFKNPGNVIISGFVFFALAMLFLVWKSMQVKFDMAVEGDYYQKEQSYNHQLEAQKNGEDLGVAFNFKTDGNKLTLHIPENLSNSLENGTVEFYCLSDSKNDTKQLIQKQPSGTFIFDRSTVAPGKNYIVKVLFSISGKDYYKEFKML
ncbi:MAG TPA: FixH family protein [Edaphocola sp.]|nr:FixH family protein [Edaphocola sp.]